MTRIKIFISGLLQSARLPLVLAALAMALTLPSLRAGRAADDYWHAAILRGLPRLGELKIGPLDLFRFFDGDPARTRPFMELGVLPWWTDPAIHGHFFRPLASLTHWIDYQLWPGSPPLMHLHSVLWFGLTVAAAAFLYRRLMGPTLAAGLAALLWAVDDAHGTPVGWLANRNAIPATLFGVLALLAHDRRRRDGWRPGLVLAPLAFALGLLSAEAGLGALAYLVAYALFLDPAGRRRGLLALVPCFALVILWRLGWTAAGAGVDRIGLYIDPVHEPLAYLRAALVRAPLLLLGQFLGPPSEISLFFGPTTMRVYLSCALAALLALGLLFAPLLRRDALARFWAAGALLSLAPICATFPADRLLWFTGLGAFGLLARFLTDPFRASLIARAAAALFIFAHLVLAPVLLPIRAATGIGDAADLVKIYDSPLLDGAAGKTVVFVNPPITLFMGYCLIARDLDGRPLPKNIRILSAGITPVTLQRLDARTLLARPEAGYLIWGPETLVRNDRSPMRAGDHVELNGMSAEVTRVTDDGRPAEARIRFDVPLEDPALRWLAWRDGAYVAFTPPAVGQSVTISLFSPASPLAGRYQNILSLLCR